MLQTDIDAINAALQFKQNLVNGTCPNGSAIREVLADGSVICEGIESSVSGTLQSIKSYKRGDIPGRSYLTVIARCPIGYAATGPGHYTAWSQVKLLRNEAAYATSFIYAYNENYYSLYAYAVATCTRFVP